MMRHGGRFNRKGQRKGGQFRDTYAYGSEAPVPIQKLLNHAGFVQAAKDLWADQCGENVVVEPQIIFANFMVPGENQMVHTDVPEFRGCSRKNTPEWLLVCMHHSRLFSKYYMPIATSVIWLSDLTSGGELAFYPDPAKPASTKKPSFNTALLLDTDSIYHGVDPVIGRSTPPPVVPIGATLCYGDDGKWRVDVPDRGNSMYEGMTWQELRMSVQWKAYCFKDEAERQLWLQHSDDISPEEAFTTLVEEVRKRGGSTGREGETQEQLAEKIVDAFVGSLFPMELRQAHEGDGGSAAAALRAGL
jgi:hypothetical protein